MPAHIKFKQELFSGLTTPSSAYTSVFVGKTAGAPSYNQGNISARLADGQLYRVPYLEEDLTYATGKEFKGNVDIAQDLTVYGNLNWTGSSSDTFVTGGTLSASTLTLTRNDGQNINIPGFLTLSGNTSGSCIDTLWVSTISGCSPVYVGPEVRIPGNLNIGKDIWYNWGDDTEGAIAIHSISGGTTGTTVMSSKAMVQQYLDGDTFKLLSISADGDTCCTGWSCMEPGTCADCKCVGYPPPDSQSLSLSPGDGFNLRTFSGTTSAETTTILDSSQFSLTKSLPTLGILHKINMEVPCGKGSPSCGDSSTFTVQRISGTTTGTTVMSAKAIVQQNLDADTFKLLSISADGDTCCTGWSCMAPGTCGGCNCVGYPPPDSQSLNISPGDGFNLTTLSGLTSGETTTILDSSKLSLNKSLPALKTATNIYPSYSQYSFSTTGMTGTSITSASKIYSSFKNNNGLTNFIGIYPVTSSGGGTGGCDCTAQWCAEGDLCQGVEGATICGCMGTGTDNGDGMYAVGSIDTVSGTTGTTMITSNSIEITTSDVGGTNLLTINSEGINISNETEGWTSANTPRTFKKTLNRTTVQSLGTPLELIPAPGDGKIINVESITLKIQGEGALITPYGGGVVLDFILDGAHVPIFQSNELLLSSASRILAIPRASEPSGPAERQIIANTKLSIATNSLTNPTGGEGLLGINITYTLEDDIWV